MFLLFLTHTFTPKRPLPKTSRPMRRITPNGKQNIITGPYKTGVNLLIHPSPLLSLHLNRRNQQVFMPLYAPFLLLLPPFLRKSQILRPHMPNLQKQTHPASQIHLQKNGRRTFSLPKIPSCELYRLKRRNSVFITALFPILTRPSA